MKFAKRLEKVGPSATFKYSALAKKPGMINLTVGRPDFDTPQIVKDAAKKALDDGKVHYTPTRGIPELRERIAEKSKSENKIDVDAEKVLVGGGAKSILFDAILALIEKGEVVAIPNPSWVSYEAMIHLAEGEVDWLPLDAERGFVPDEEFFSALENSKAKLLIINSPNNPTGAVYPRSVFAEIIDICRRKNIFLISDECYEAFVYEGEHFSPGSVYDDTLTVNAFSKSFSMTGWRLGYAVCRDLGIIDKMNIIHGQSLSCATSFAQYGALACFTGEAREYSKRMIQEFRGRRDYVMQRIENLGVVCRKPAGAFYVFPKFNEDDLKLADKLLGAGVGTVPGSPFGSKGKNCLRISYGSGDVKVLKDAFDRIEDVVK